MITGQGFCDPDFVFNFIY